MSVLFPEINVKTTGKAAELLKDQILAISDEDAQSSKKSATSIMGVMHVYLKNLGDDLPIINEQCNKFTITNVEFFLNTSMSFWYFDNRCKVVDPKAAERKKIYKEANEAKKKVTKILDVTDGNDPAVTYTLEVTKPGRGYVDTANDLDLIYPLLNEKREKLVAAGLMSDEEIDRIAVLPRMLVDNTEDDIKAARLLRNKAWTLFLQSYEEIRRHVEFIHYYQPKKLANYPSIYSYKKSRKKKPDLEIPPTE